MYLIGETFTGKGVQPL